MQGTRLAGRKRINKYIFIFTCIVIIVGLTVVDQVTKNYFAEKYFNYGETTIINNFFYLSFTKNTGAAWSFLQNKSWSQIFFKILTIFALIIFVLLFIYSVKKNYKWLNVSLSLVIAGTIGNFIDRIKLSYVIDFLKFKFGNWYFPVFNFADVFLTVGVIMLVIHFLFLDNNKLFCGKSNGKE